MTNAAIAKGGLGTELDEAEELAAVRKQIKQREDSAQQFRSAGRHELADKGGSGNHRTQAIHACGTRQGGSGSHPGNRYAGNRGLRQKDMGRVMKLMQERTAGRFNGKELAQMVSARLS